MAVSLGTLSAPRQAWNFVRHYLEMCVSMCIGGGTLFALIFVVGPGVLGYADPRSSYPELSLLVVAVAFTLPMALWMRLRGMPWAPILEMSAAALAVALVFLALGWAGILSRGGIAEFASLAFCGPACIAMFGAMLFRLDLYTGRSGHHMAHA